MRRLVFSSVFSLVLVVIVTLFTGPARATPIGFDFEDGLQGWTLEGSAQRVNTQVLGGEWAIFGDGLLQGGAAISLEVDLTNIAEIRIEQFSVAGARFAVVHPNVRTRFFSGPDGGNPGTRILELDDTLRRVGVLRIQWFPLPTFGLFETLPLPEGPAARPQEGLAFIDNVTLIPIPEPSTALLVLGGLGAASALRRRSRESVTAPRSLSR